MRKGSGEERESVLQSGWTVEGREQEPQPVAIEPQDEVQVESEEQEPSGDESAPAQMGNLTVVLLGVSGGIFLLFAWIWMSWAKHYAGVNAAVAAGSGSIGGVLQQIVFWIAPLAPVLWFIAAVVLVRNQPKKLALALLLGIIVTLPFPMIFSSGAAL